MQPAVTPDPNETDDRTITSRFLDFFRTQSASGVVLIVATIVALVAANSLLAETYHHLLETPISIGVGDRALDYSLHFWINDRLMVIFFFVIGLEIKREALIGELASLRQSALPIAGALGGMIVPALLFILLNGGSDAARGWGIPMATDIAFALGIFGFGRLAIKLGLASLPGGTSWKALHGVAVLAGIGFTMSLFVTELACAGFPELAADAKIGVLAASIVAGAAGYLLVSQGASTRRPETREIARSVQDVLHPDCPWGGSTASRLLLGGGIGAAAG